MSAQRRRAAEGGRIDRSEPISFRFDGRLYQGYRGDTLASALLANGVRLVGRSFKYHRPRGIFGAGFEEPNALLRVGAGDRAEPNLKATQVELVDGLEATSQHHWPSLSFDVGAINNALSRFLPAGFYYKTFMWPGSWWMLYERVIRAAAGLGRASSRPDPDHYARRFAFCDVLVVGAGPAGLCAALAAGRSGARVVLIEDAPALGGSLRGASRSIDGRDGGEWAAEVAAELASLANVRVLTRTTAFGYYDGNMIVAAERVTDHEREPAHGVPRQRVWWIRAKEAVLATGALERPLVFENNDLPGVMLASAATVYAREYAVRCGDRAVVFTNNDSAYEAVAALQAVGASVSAVVDAREGGAAEHWAAMLKSRGIEAINGSAVTRAVGRGAVRSVEVRRLSSDGQSVEGPARTLACDLLCVSGGWNPTVHLFSQSQGKLVFDESLTAFVPGESAQAEQSAGASRGLYTLAGCLEDGARAGSEAARRVGLEGDYAAPGCGEEPEGAPIRALWTVPMPGRRRGKRFVDFQNDVTVADIELASREGYSSVEHLKRYTTLGMGTDQGRTSNVNGLAVLAATLGKDIPSVGTTTFRPPFSPVPLGAIAGREVGANHTPIRRTPMHAWHEAAGACFVEVGPWLRAQYYPRAGESVMDAINREVIAVRRSVGIVDVSTLGKIEVRGRDAAEFLHRVYINRITNLRLGRCRYAFMLREDGFVLDDGTVTRVGESEFYLTTGTGHAGAVMSHLEYYAQTVWPDLEVHLSSVTDQWAGAAISGPSSLDVLAAACDGADVSDTALPFMGYMEATIGGAPVRIIRMTFSGERAYEVHCPADFGVPVWRVLLDAGQPFDIVPYGTEALGVLRIEKGHVVPNELDGRTIPADFGFDRMEKDDDFIGKRSLEREAFGADRDRKTFVGLVSQDGRPVPRGAQLCWNPTAPKPLDMLGHVTSQCYSPHLEAYIGLALLRDGAARKGEVLYAASPVTSSYVPVLVSDPTFIDPENLRPRA